MIRSFYALTALVFVAATVWSCNNPACGPGTKQLQAANGDLQCVPAETPSQLTPCDVDGGTVDIVGGNCVSHIKCDPGTTMYDPGTGVCVGTGTGTGCPACPTPVPPGQVCVTGGVVDFQTGMHITGGASSRALRIGIYEPLAFLNSPNVTPLAEAEGGSTTKGCFTFTVPAPSSNLIALAVQDPVGATPAAPLIIGGSGATIVPGTSYKVDAYMVTKATQDSYAAVNPAFQSMGTYVGCYYNQPPPAITNLVFSETMPAAGVHLLENGSTPGTVRYLKADGTVDTTLTATSAAKGCAIEPGNNGVNQFGGSGGGVTKWETQPGGTTVNVVFIGRYHTCDGQPMTGTCQ